MTKLYHITINKKYVDQRKKIQPTKNYDNQQIIHIKKKDKVDKQRLHKKTLLLKMMGETSTAAPTSDAYNPDLLNKLTKGRRYGHSPITSHRCFFFH